jgi:two-component system LytT family response regulator
MGYGIGFRTLVAVGDPVENERVLSILNATEGVSLLGNWAPGEDLTTLIIQTEPDLLILSIDLGEKNGFEVLNSLGGLVKPLLILLSRNNKDAVSAFRYHPLDFLLLPVDEVHLAETLGRAKAALAEKNGLEGGHNVLDILSGKRKNYRPARRIMVKSSGRIFFVKQEEIDWIDAERDYICIHNCGKKYLIRQRISEMEKQLPSERFLRIHRSTIVNVERIRELHPLSYGEYAVILHDGTRLTLSRSYRGRVFERLTTAA